MPGGIGHPCSLRGYVQDADGLTVLRRPETLPRGMEAADGELNLPAPEPEGPVPNRPYYS
jgi:hypothetical protein